MRPERNRTLRGAAGSALVAAAALLITTGSPASDWPQYRGDDGDGVSDEKVLSAPTELWTASVGTGYSSVIVCSGRVYAAGHVEEGGDRGTDTVYCLDAATGNEVWTYSYGARSTSASEFGGTSTTPPGDLDTAGPRATPATDGSYVFVPSLDGNVFCLDAATGEVIWCRNVEAHMGGAVKTYGYCSSPRIHDDKLILDVSGTCVALNKATGEELWRRNAGGGWCCAVSPVICTPNGPSSTYVVFGSRNVAAALVTDGSLLWEYGMGRECMTQHIVTANRVFFSTYPDSGRSVLLDTSGASPTPVWEDTSIMTYHLTSVLSGGYLYVMENSGTEWAGNDSSTSALKCLDFATGQEEWSTDGLGWATAIAADGEIIVLREAGQLLRIAASPTYSEVASPAQVIDQWTWTSPALAEGRLYCRNCKGDVVCLSTAPAVTVQATDPMAHETGPDTGTFTVSRVAASNSGDLVVTIVTGGTEIDGADLAGGSITPTAVTIPDGSASVDVTVTPTADGDPDDETVVITLQDDLNNYVVGWRDSATVHVLDAGASLPTVGVSAAGADGYALEGGPDTGAFTVLRSASADWPLVVDVSFGGTAAASDYSLVGTDGATVTIPAGQTSALVTLTALGDATDEGDETVILSVGANPTYYSGTDSATITIVDDDDAEVDADSDGMDDGWETCYWGDTLTSNGSDDFDGDGLSDAGEYVAGTDPTDVDTDKDDCSDGKEVTDGSNPLSPTSYYLPAPSDGGDGGPCGGAGAVGAGAVGLAALVLALRALARGRRGPPLAE